MKCIEAKTDKEIETAFAIRDRVFIEEQGVAPEIEYDQYDQNAIHIIGSLEDIPIAAARIRLVANKALIQRVAILKPYRNQGYGKKLMFAIEKISQQNKVNYFYLNAQAHAIPFYQKIGYKICSQPFFEAGIKHVTMMKVNPHSMGSSSSPSEF